MSEDDRHREGPRSTPLGRCGPKSMEHRVCTSLAMVS